MTIAPLLSVTDLRKVFPGRNAGLRRRGQAPVHAVDGVTFTLNPGETLGVVGESGCGKSTMARCITRLIEPTQGTVSFNGRDITRLTERELRPLRRDIAMIFQDPYASLDPRQKIGSIIGEPLLIHHIADANRTRSRVHELLEIVGLSAEHYDRYPHEFSGGQRQRVGIARALATNPKLIVCDEPTSALDVSIQAQILNLLKDLQEKFALTYVFISHDLGVVRYIADRLLVMYLGRVLEHGQRDQVFTHPRHPYTASLLAAVPEPDPTLRQYDAPAGVQEPQATGHVQRDPGQHVCVYAPRCFQVRPDRCLAEAPCLRRVEEGGEVACFYPLTGELSDNPKEARNE